jgi:hypothetical protein
MKVALIGLCSGLLSILMSCGNSPSSNFIGNRIPDACGGDWPVCTTFAGCRLDETSYTQGNLPGSTKFIVSTTGPATLTLSMFVTNAQAAGTDTSFTFFEPGCGVQYRIDVSGLSFFAESQNEEGLPFVRTQTVSEAGDHLIELDSDATCSYLLKIDIAEQNTGQ